MARQAKTTTVVLELPTKLVEAATIILQGRGSDIEDYVRLKLKSLMRPTRHYDLYETYNFGKYKDEVVATVIRTDPEYVAWCLREVEGFGLTPEALGVLESTGVDL